MIFRKKKKIIIKMAEAHNNIKNKMKTENLNIKKSVFNCLQCFNITLWILYYILFITLVIIILVYIINNVEFQNL